MLIADAECGPCSNLGRIVARETGISAASFGDFEEWVDGDSNEVEMPFLVEFRDGEVVKMWSGWSMRARIARELGILKLPLWLKLYSEELVSRRDRMTSSGTRVSRRLMLSGALATVLVGSMGVQPASAKSESSRALSSGNMSRIVSNHADLIRRNGEVKVGYQSSSPRGESSFILLHKDGKVSTVLEDDPTFVVTNSLINSSTIRSEIQTELGVLVVEYRRLANGEPGLL